MRVIILGASGLIGHSLYRELGSQFETFGTLHYHKKSYGDHRLFNNSNIIENIDISDFQVLCGVLREINPDVIINCIGITKRKKEIDNAAHALYINSLFPHKLAEWAEVNNKRLIHLSTDCVFDGKTGNYNEKSLTTAEDIYGRTKAFGEVDYNHTLTIRSSFIGRELFSKTELLEWFLSQKGPSIKGFTKALYSGVSTKFLSKIVVEIIHKYPNLFGIKQLAIEEPISKFDLLCLARNAFKLDIEIIPDESFELKPTLNGEKLKDELDYVVPTWERMMNDLANDPFKY
jgi:dTDP-4-dehydrorhamnose reductase